MSTLSVFLCLVEKASAEDGGKGDEKPLRYSELFQKPGLFKEQNAGFSAQIHSVTVTKTWLEDGEDLLIYFIYLYQSLKLDFNIKWEEKQELREVFKFPIQIFWIIGAGNFLIRSCFISDSDSLDYGNLNPKKQNYQINMMI